VLADCSPYLQSLNRHEPSTDLKKNFCARVAIEIHWFLKKPLYSSGPASCCWMIRILRGTSPQSVLCRKAPVRDVFPSMVAWPAGSISAPSQPTTIQTRCCVHILRCSANFNVIFWMLSAYHREKHSPHFHWTAPSLFALNLACWYLLQRTTFL